MEPTIRTEAGDEGVVVAGGRVMTSPLAVIALPGNRVCDPMTNPESEFAVMLSSPTTITGEGLLVGFTPLTIMAPSELADTTCPPAVIAEPRTRVCEPITRFEAESCDAVREPIKTGAGAGPVEEADGVIEGFKILSDETRGVPVLANGVPLLAVEAAVFVFTVFVGALFVRVSTNVEEATVLAGGTGVFVFPEVMSELAGTVAVVLPAGVTSTCVLPGGAEVLIFTSVLPAGVDVSGFPTEV